MRRWLICQSANTTSTRDAMPLQLATKPTIFLSSSLTRLPTTSIVHPHFQILTAEEYRLNHLCFHNYSARKLCSSPAFRFALSRRNLVKLLAPKTQVMAPISAMAPAGAQSTTLSSAGKPLKRGMSLRRASTQRQPRNHQQQLPPQFLQPMQGQLDSDEDEDTIISCHPSFQTYRHRDRQSHYVDPRQQMLHLPDSQRPASSRSHMRDWNHNHQRERSRSPSSSKKLPPPDSLSQQPQSEYYSSLPSSTSLTSEEFEALPPTVRRKVSGYSLPRPCCYRCVCSAHRVVKTSLSDVLVHRFSIFSSLFFF